MSLLAFCFSGCTFASSDESLNRWNVVYQFNGMNLLDIASADENTFVAVGFGSSNDILRSTDKGFSWTTVSVPSHQGLSDVAFSSRGEGLAVGFNGVILRSTNRGADWARITQADLPLFGLTSVCFVNDLVAFAVGSNGVLLKSTDAGSSWLNSSNELSTSQGLNKVYRYDSSILYIVGDRGGIFKSQDGGETWIAQTSGFLSPLESIHFFDSNTGMACGRTGLFLKTTNSGATWEFKTAFTDRPAYDVLMLSDSRAVAVGGYFLSNLTYATTFETTDSGSFWVQTDSPPAPILSFKRVLDGFIAVGSGGYVLVSNRIF
jgi:photosystem II stability/assembly factor-like uncharacterized protein